MKLIVPHLGLRWFIWDFWPISVFFLHSWKCESCLVPLVLYSLISVDPWVALTIPLSKRSCFPMQTNDPSEFLYFSAFSCPLINQTEQTKWWKSAKPGCPLVGWLLSAVKWNQNLGFNDVNPVSNYWQTDFFYKTKIALTLNIDYVLCSPYLLANNFFTKL